MLGKRERESGLSASPSNLKALNKDHETRLEGATKGSALRDTPADDICTGAAGETAPPVPTGLASKDPTGAVSARHSAGHPNGRLPSPGLTQQANIDQSPAENNTKKNDKTTKNIKNIEKNLEIEEGKKTMGKALMPAG